MADIPPPEMPGWYADAEGEWWYWDGASWTPAPAVAATSASGPKSSERTEAVIVWVLMLIVGFVGPLVMYVINREKAFVRHHAAEALNFTILTLPVTIVAFGLMLSGWVSYIEEVPDDPFDLGTEFWVGMGLAASLTIVTVGISLLGLLRASKGQWTRLPLLFHPVRGVVKSGEDPYPVS